jgi:voltage-gated potassium channel
MIDQNTQEMVAADSERQEHSTYEVFILALAYLSLLGAVVFYFLSFSNRHPLLVFDTVICIVFFFDFLRSLYRAPSKQAYLRWGWLDLVGSIPGFPILRLARIHRIINGTRILRAVGYRGALRSFLSRRAESTLLTTLLGTLLILGLVTILMVGVERQSPEANIITIEEA